MHTTAALLSYCSSSIIGQHDNDDTDNNDDDDFDDDDTGDNHDDLLSLKMRKILFEEKNILAEILIYRCSISQ